MPFAFEGRKVRRRLRRDFREQILALSRRRKGFEFPSASIVVDQGRSARRFKTLAALCMGQVQAISTGQSVGSARGIEFLRRQAVELKTMDEAVVQLVRLARESHGEYDGWETELTNHRG